MGLYTGFKYKNRNLRKKSISKKREIKMFRKKRKRIDTDRPIASAFKIVQPKAYRFTLIANVVVEFSYQMGSNVIVLPGRTIRHIIVHVHNAEPQAHPEVQLSFDGNSWFGMHEEEIFLIPDVFCDKFFVRTIEDDVDVSFMFIPAQEFRTES